nr:MAG TPA: hypothetical protein [Caudoviricetes sp.]
MKNKFLTSGFFGLFEVYLQNRGEGLWFLKDCFVL